MVDKQEPDDGDFPLTAIQRKVLSETHHLIGSVSSHKNYATTTSITEALKRSVYDAIVQLSEVVSEKFLKTLLPFLHCTAWDEVVEERFLGNPRLCGFPTCNEVIIRREKKQRFHIDREARKIYENRMVRDMYCSRLCMLRSSSIRAQLADEPLWISGNIKKRISLPYITDATMVVNNMTSENVGIEIVNVVEEKLSDLRIRETEVSTSSDSEDDEECLTDVDSVHDLLDGNIDDKKDFNNERNQKLGADTDLSGGDSDKKMMKNSTKISCSSTFSIDKESVNKSGTLVNNQRLPDPQMSSNCSLTEAELEKLARLRSKYSGYAVKKPVVIEPVPTTSTSTEERHCLRKQHGKESNVDAIVDCSDTQKTVELVWNLFRSDTVFMKFNSIGWITERTYHVLRYGSSHVSVSSFAIMDVSRESEIDHVCSDEIFLPTVDSLDVRKKRLQIFLETVKKPIAMYQHQLKFAFSEYNWLFAIAATFSLGPDTITNFHKNTLKLVCIVLLKMISMVDKVLEDSLFSEHQTYRFSRLLIQTGVEKQIFDALISKLFGDVQKKHYAQ